MEEALVAGIVKQLQPAFYFIGAFCVMVFAVFGGTLLKILHETKKTRERKIDSSLEGLKTAVVENTTSISKLSAKFEYFVERHDKDMNAFGNKIRELRN